MSTKLNNIKSNYILNKIFDYIKERTFKCRLFKYSKEMQKRCELNLELYIYEYILKFDISPSKYLTYSSPGLIIDKFDIKILDNKLKKDLIYYKLDLKDMLIFVKYYYKNQIKNFKNIINGHICYENYEYVDIYSPFFKYFLENEKEIIEKVFTITIDVPFIKKFNLNNIYISFIDKLNNDNIKYSSLMIYYNDKNDKDFLNDLNFNLECIKSLNIQCVDYLNDSFFQKIFTKNIYNNLLYLDLDFFGEVKLDSFIDLNNFNSLIQLILNGLEFKSSSFIMKLKNLKVLILCYCKNIILEQITCTNLKRLEIFRSNINSNSLLKFPELEELSIGEEGFNETINIYDNFLDFSSLINLKRLNTFPKFFINLKNIKLYQLDLSEYININLDIKKKSIEKLLKMDTLKIVNLQFQFKNKFFSDLSKIVSINQSIKKLTIDIYINDEDEIENNNDDKIITLFDFQNKMTNLKELKINYYDYSIKEISVEIIENVNSKINSIELNIIGTNLKFYCGPFKDLINFYFYSDKKIKNLNFAFPIFNDKCNIIFESLNSFTLNLIEIDLDILNNIYNNLDKMPNVKKFTLITICTKIKKEFYLKFVTKILSMNINEINIDFEQDINMNEMTENELKEINPNLKFNNIYKIHIKKLS